MILGQIGFSLCHEMRIARNYESWEISHISLGLAISEQDQTSLGKELA